MKLIDPKMSIDTIRSYIEVWDCKGCLPYGGTQHNVMAVDDLLCLPIIEAEPVIHCKDCAFWESKRVSCEGLARCRTGESGYRYRFGHDFCSRAQRREEVSEDAGTD